MGRKNLLAMAISIACFIGAAGNAEAQWYVSGNAGAAILSDADATDVFAGGSGEGTVDHSTGSAVSGALGYSWKAFRLEGEVSYRKNDLDSLKVNTLTLAGIGRFNALGTFNIEGDISSLAFMANGWYDYDTGTPWTPFIGGGIGAARINLDVTKIGATAIVYDESDTVFAYQLGAGMGYKLTPSTMLALSYRYFGTSDARFNDGADKVEWEYQSHNVLLGLNVKF